VPFVVLSARSGEVADRREMSLVAVPAARMHISRDLAPVIAARVRFLSGLRGCESDGDHGVGDRRESALVVV
jgi:hypothetical protein